MVAELVSVPPIYTTPRENQTTSAKFYGKTPKTALIYNFGIIQNEDSYSSDSLVSDNSQGYYSSEVGIDSGGGRDTNFVDMELLGQYKDWQSGSARCRYVETNGYQQVFEVEHIFVIPLWYLDGERSNLDSQQPTINFANDNTLKYVHSPQFLNVISNPNTSISEQFDSELGSVAWFNKNFNGFNNNYEILSVDYEEAATTNVADGILASTKTKVTIVVDKILGSFNSSDRLGVYVSYLPEESEYTNIINANLLENFIYDNAIGQVNSTLNQGSSFVENLEISSIQGDGTLIVTFETNYNTAQKFRIEQKINNGAGYLIGLELADGTISSANSDYVMLLADSRDYDDSADIPNLFNVNRFNLYQHPLEVGAFNSFTSLECFNEDDVYFAARFDLNRDLEAKLNSLEFKLIAYNSTTNNFFELDSFVFPNIDNAPIVGGTQQININSLRGYKLPIGSVFNIADLTTGVTVLNKDYFNVRIGQKISWQSWIKNLGVDNVFFDASKDNDNLNHKTSNYSNLNGYDIHLCLDANVYGRSQLGTYGNTNYLFLTPPLTVWDYDKDHTNYVMQEINTYHPVTNVNLNGKVLVGEDTLFKTVWTKASGSFDVGDLAQMWALHYIEESNQQGYDIYELSSITAPMQNNLLKELPGSSFLDVQLVGGTIVTTCLIDGTKTTNVNTVTIIQI
jgi:hypothetical protein